jgi:hypothetical protein
MRNYNNFAFERSEKAFLNFCRRQKHHFAKHNIIHRRWTSFCEATWPSVKKLSLTFCEAKHFTSHRDISRCLSTFHAKRSFAFHCGNTAAFSPLDKYDYITGSPSVITRFFGVFFAKNPLHKRLFRLFCNCEYIMNNFFHPPKINAESGSRD